MKELVRFLIIGVINTALMYALYVGLLRAGMHYQVALAIDYGCGVLMGYVCNRQWTFADDGKKLWSFLRYASTYIGIYAANVVLLLLIVETGWLNPVLGQLLAVIVVAVISFLSQKYWVFKNKNS